MKYAEKRKRNYTGNLDFLVLGRRRSTWHRDEGRRKEGKKEVFGGDAAEHFILDRNVRVRSYEPPRVARIYLELAMPQRGNRMFFRYKKIILSTEAKQVVVASCL